jgi:hypothetical protein
MVLQGTISNFGTVFLISLPKEVQLEIRFKHRKNLNDQNK